MTQAVSPIIQVSNLTKTYPHQTNPALADVSFQIQPCQKVGVIGANGSGKTTLFRLLSNLLKADAGFIKITGNSNLEKTKKHLGFVSEYQEGLENFTPAEILAYAGRMSGMSGKTVADRAEELLAWSNLASVRDNLIGSFSKGMRQRLFLSVALVSQPSILLLDEPMSGLDPGSQQEFRTLLKDLDSYTILYASHQLGEIEDLCERVIIFHRGMVLRDLELKELQKNIFILESNPSILKVLENYRDIKLRQKKEGRDSFSIEISSSPLCFQDFLSDCKKQNIPIFRIKSKSGLEDLYDKYTEWAQ